MGEDLRRFKPAPDLSEKLTPATAPSRAASVKDHHKVDFLSGVSVQVGDTVLTGNGTPKEKSVDAMLVADLVYHAAVRNIDYAVLVSVDTDFVRAIKRVEDFGCKTAVVGVCASVPPRLQEATDEVIEYSEAFLLQENIVNPDNKGRG